MMFVSVMVLSRQANVCALDRRQVVRDLSAVALGVPSTGGWSTRNGPTAT
jgi:hypothetical protein